MEPGLQLSQEQPPVKNAVVKLDRATYVWYLRYDPDRFWRACKKSCFCEKGDLRLENGAVECGKCGSKLRYK